MRKLVAVFLCAISVPASRCAGPGTGGASATEPKPNVILYVIDGAAAERMSVYGYGRRTTPWLERLAAEGAVFENAYSNSSFTKTSVPSFMTSLHSSVLGATRSAADGLPARAATMAERMRAAGYATEVLTSNPYCGRLSGLDRGADVVRDGERGRRSPSSLALGREFWDLRESRPAGPYWVHIQTTDVHRPWGAGGSPFRSRVAFVGGPDRLDLFDRPPRGPEEARLFEAAGDLYDECLARQDRSIGRLMEDLKRSGDWGRTLLVVASDHGHFAAGLPLRDPAAPPWPTPVLASHKSRVPLIFVWPGRIAPGLRIPEQVSMIDLLPTVLELAGLPRPDVAQGRSLAPLLLGRPGWKPRPVVLDELYGDGRRVWGSLEVVDGRWGASLWIDTRPFEDRPRRDRLRPAPLLVFDIETDPHAFRSLHRERPDLVAKYSRMLARLRREHRALAGRFGPRQAVRPASAEVETLRTLGYIR